MKIDRLTPEPIISVLSHPEAGNNINGPSLIHAPAWLKHPLGRYYLYFAHHNGKYIRLAVADSLCGPWRLVTSGVLSLDRSGFSGHIASPDVHVDYEAQKILMYFHGSDLETDAVSPQYTRLAVSDDGLDFEPRTDNLGNAYWRVFRWQGYYYALEMPGVFRRAQSAYGPFEPGVTLFTDVMRHSAVALRGSTLDVFYSNIGDCPESILYTAIDISVDWKYWKAGKVVSLAKPRGRFEGGECPLVPSKVGIAIQPENALRDPAYYEEGERRFLLFSVAGEQGIAIAALDDS